MRLVDFAPLGRSVSAIGFGCASLGSRIDARRGREALARAYDAGVSWFDVAPPYGDGHAEILLGEFLAGKRSQVSICTKVGILPSRAPFALRIARPIVRQVIGLVPKLRKQVAGFRPAAQSVRLTGSFIESSVVESLKRLQTDYIDVLALHEPQLADVQREDVREALDTVVSKGYARTVSVAGDLNVAVAAVALSKHFGVIQVASNPYARSVALAKQQLPVGRSVGFVTHSVYGHGGSLDTLMATITKQANTRALMDSMGYCGTSKNAAAAFLLDFALASNSEGVILLSMYEQQHFSFNIGRLTASPPPEVVLNLANHINPPQAYPGLLEGMA
jgi:aryl-alcohol dehydrogenase-like predicted oxidoreductase